MMASNDQGALEKSEGKRLLLRITQQGRDAEHALEFKPGDERVRVLGASASADVLVRARGVLPVHCYFEREPAGVVIALAQQTARASVNCVPLGARLLLAERSVLDVGEARLHATLTVLDDDAPELAPQTLDRAAIHYSLDDFRTASFDADALADDLPTTALRRPQLQDFSGQTVALSRAAVLPVAVAVEGPPVVVEAVQITERIPLAVIPRPASVPAPTNAPAPPAPAPAEASAPVAPPAEPPAPAVNAPANDAELITTSQPIADLVPSPTEPIPPVPAPPVPAAGNAPPSLAPLVRSRPARPGEPSLLTLARSDFARWERERKLVPLTVLLGVLLISFASLGKQSVELWRAERAAHAVILPAPQASPVVPVTPRCEPASGQEAEIVQARLASDPHVAEAVQHLVRGRRREAAAAYRELVPRYPSVCAFSLIARVLAERLDGKGDGAPIAGGKDRP